ncbi:hypothetical protein GLGCALEP_06220 [Pseudomonas sp. MM221]|nr:hypothetical protein DBADOPDK_06068 [Pseudomonas sp. MM223]CAI3810848.1 hypothetical protein GLGCALEP_06220 [Pseudomonas sp. MM221]
MNQTASITSTPLVCRGPATDAAVVAMANLSAAQGIDLTQHQPLAVKVRQWVTPEGARASFTAVRDRPMFDLALRFRAGSALDGDSPGLAALVLYSLDQGTEQLDNAQFAQLLEGHGAIMNRSISHDEAVVTLRCLSLPALRTSALSLFTQMLAQPALRPADVARIRERLATVQRARAWYPSTRMSDATMAHLFADHPYAIPVTGTAEGLDAITNEQLRAFHQRAYSANNVDIGLVGNLSPEEAQQLVADLVKALPQNWAAQAPETSLPPNTRTQHLEKTGTTTSIMLTVPATVSPGNPWHPALVMLDEILGGGFESRLTQELRVKRALTYSASSSLQPLDAANLLQIEWDIAPEYRDASCALVANMLACLSNHGPSQVECDVALSQLSGKLQHALASNENLAKGLATFSHQGLPADHLATYPNKLAALTPLDIREAAKALLAETPHVLISLGPDVEQQALPSPPATDQ